METQTKYRAGCLLRGAMCLSGALLVFLAVCGCVLLNEPPVAVATLSPTSGTAPLLVTLDASDSYDLGSGYIYSYSWSLGDGTWASGCRAYHTFSGPGVYTVRLTVEDNYGLTDSCTRTVSVYSRPEEPSSSLAPVPFALTSEGFWEFVWYCQDWWRYESDLQGELVQHPSISFARMAGDCDDFATMIAGYAQAYWPYDSYVAHLEMLDTDTGHAVAFIRVRDYATLEWYFQPCPGRWPYRRNSSGSLYLPIDQSRCLWWHWVEFGGTAVYKWDREWDWWVGRPRSVMAPPPA